MKVLMFTNMYPCDEDPSYGVFVKEQIESLRRSGVEVKTLFINGRKSKLNYLKGAILFLRECRSNSYDVIHAHHTYCAAIARLQRKRPVILTLHEGEASYRIGVRDRIRDYGFWKVPIFSSRLKRLMSRNLEGIIAVSSCVGDELGLKRTETIPCGVDLDRFRPMSKRESRLELGFPLGDRVILFPASPHRIGKRFEIVQKAIEILNRSVPDVRLITLGGVPYELVPRYMNASDVLVFTSAYEASPMVIKEALAVNLPIVSTDVGDVKEMIGETRGCFICDGSPEEVAGVLKKAFEYRGSVKGRERILALGLGLKQTANRVVKVYETVLESSS